MIRKRQIAATVCGVLFGVLLILYIAVVRPLTKVSEETAPPPDLIEGETLDSTGNYRLMFPHIPRERIDKIEVSGAGGDYRVERATLNGEETFVINGYKGITYQDEAFSSLIVTAGYAVTRDRLAVHGTEEEFKRYGLDTPQLTWTITDTGGKSYTVEVGDRLISGGGYYARLVGRDAIYIISSNVENNLLLPVENFVNPVVCAGMSQETYMMVDNFILAHGDEAFISIRQSKKENFSNPDANYETEIFFPASYKTNDTFFFNIIASFMSLIGDETVYFGEDTEELEKYGLSLATQDPAHSVYFTHGDQEYYMFFSELQPDGYYYATSNLTDYLVISKIPEKTLSWLTADLSDWVYNYPIMHNIAYVDSITVETGGEAIEFNLVHGKNADDKPTLEVNADNGFTLSNSDVYNFREFYKVLLSVQLMGDADMTDEARDELLSGEDAHMVTVTFNMSSGKVNEYSFYRYSTRRALFTANGDGRFYVMTDWVEKIVSDMDRMLNGLEVDSYTKN